MELCIYIASMCATIICYALGAHDEEKQSAKGLIVWAVVFGTVGVWLLATWWAQRGE